MAQSEEIMRVHQKYLEGSEFTFVMNTNRLRRSVFKVVLPDGGSGTMFAATYCRSSPGQQVDQNQELPEVRALITNNHIVPITDDNFLNKCKLQFAPKGGQVDIGEGVEIRLVQLKFGNRWTKPGYDVTILELTNQAIKILEREGIEYLPISAPQVNEKVDCVGYPEGKGPKESPGTILSIDTNTGGISHNASTLFGSSGSPLINIEFNAVAMIWGHLKSDIELNRATDLVFVFKLFSADQAQSHQNVQDENTNASFYERIASFWNNVGSGFSRQASVTEAKRAQPTASKSASADARALKLKTEIEPPEISTFVNMMQKNQGKFYATLLQEKLEQYQVVQLVGEAGFGKTSLGLHIAYEQARSGTVVRWIQADSMTAIQTGLKQILDELNLLETYKQRVLEDQNPTRFLKRMVETEIEKVNGQVLIILDNVEHLEDIEMLLQLPPKNAKYLVTSRMRFLATQKDFRIANANIVQLEPFDGDASKELVKKTIKQECSDETLNQLLKNFEVDGQYSPLALSLAIKKCNSDARISAEQFAQNFKNVHKNDSVAEEVKHIAGKILKEKAEFPMTLIQCAAYLDSEFVPGAAVEFRLKREVTKEEIEKAIQSGLFTEVQRGEYYGFRVHKLIQESLRKLFELPKQIADQKFDKVDVPEAETILLWVTEFLNDAFPLCESYLLDEFSTLVKRAKWLATQVVALDKHNPKSKEEIEVRAQLYYKYHFYLSGGESNEVKNHRDDKTKRDQQTNDARIIMDRALCKPEALSRRTHALLLYAQGRCALKLDSVSEAKSALTQSLNLLGTLITGDPKDNKIKRSEDEKEIIKVLAQVYYQLAQTYAELDINKEAIDSYRESIQLREVVKEDTFRYKLELAKCYRAKMEIHKRDRDWTPANKCRGKAKELLKDLKKDLESKDSGNSKRRTTVLHESIRLEPSPEFAIPYLNEKLAIEEKEYADNPYHRDLGWTLHELGIKYSYEQVQKWEEAEKYFLRAKKVREANQSLGLANTLHSLAKTYIKGFEGTRAKEAVPLLLRAIKLDRQGDYQRIMRRIEDLQNAYELLGNKEREVECKTEYERLKQLCPKLKESPKKGESKGKQGESKGKQGETKGKQGDSKGKQGDSKLGAGKSARRS